MQGQLFTTDFLLRGITELQVWHNAGQNGYSEFRTELLRVLTSRTAQSELNEAQTEDEIVKPILNALGFADAWLPQVNIGKKGREDVPDYLVFADAARKAEALLRSEADRPRLGLAVVEAKRWLREQLRVRLCAATQDSGTDDQSIYSRATLRRRTRTV